jgi:hypothetical protein
MHRAFSLVTALAVGGAFVSFSSSAHALGPLDLEIGLKAGVGTNPADAPSPNPLGFGIGGRAGIAIVGLYAGLNTVYYLGGSTTILGGKFSTNAWLYGLEGGYGFKLLDGLLTIRPQIGIGNAVFYVSDQDSSTSDSHLYLEPGVTGLISFGGLFVGADANVLVIPNVTTGINTTKTYSAFTLHAQAGLKF